MKIIILDTNIILKYSSLKRYAIRTLGLLSEIGIIKIALPEIVVNEAIGNKLEYRKKALGDIIINVDKLKYYDEIHEYSKIELIHTKILELEESSTRSITRELDDYLSKSKCEILKVTKGDYDSAFRRYFSGNKPFNNCREKEHILDALIFQMITRLAKSEEVIFISEDKNLREAVASNGISTFESIEKYFSIKEIADILKEKKLFNSKELFISDFYNQIYEKIIENIKTEMFHYILNDSSQVESCTIIHDVYATLMIEKNEIRLNPTGSDASTYCEIIFSANTYKGKYVKGLSEVKKIIVHAYVDLEFPERIPYSIKALDQIKIKIGGLWNVVIVD